MAARTLVERRLAQPIANVAKRAVMVMLGATVRSLIHQEARASQRVIAMLDQ
jgi:hypothetical protein